MFDFTTIHLFRELLSYDEIILKKIYTSKKFE